MLDRHRGALLLQRRARADHAGPHRARRSPCSRCGSGRASDTGYNARARRHRRRAQRPLREPVGRPRRRRVQPPAPQRAATTATSSATTATPTTTPPSIAAIVRRRAPSSSGCSARRRCSLIGGTMVQRRHALGRRARRVHPLPQRVLPADPAAGAAVQPVPAGPGRDHQAQRAARDRTRRVAGGATTPSRSRRSTARSSLDDVSFGYDPAMPGAARRRPPHRGRRDDRRSSARPAPASRRSPSSSRASTTRPEGSVAHRRPRPARRHASSRCARQLGVVPQEPFLFAGTIRDNIAFARPDADRRRGHARRSHRVGLTELVDRLPEGARHPGARARRVAVVGRAPAHRAGPRLPRRRRACSCSTRPRRTSTSSRRRMVEAGARRGARGPHRDHRRPPPVDRDARRPHRRRRRRPDRRARVARGARRHAAAATPRCTRPGPRTSTPITTTSRRWATSGPRGRSIPTTGRDHRSRGKQRTMANQIPIVDYLVLDDGDPHLVANECTECGALFFDRRNACAHCANRAFAQEDASGPPGWCARSRSCTRRRPACRCPTCRRSSTSTAAAT